MRAWPALALSLFLGCSSPPDSEGDGFVSLFNGQDLSGWMHVNDGPETWSVRDGMIVTSGHPNGILRSSKMYENFILELEWRHVKENGNSGLFVHSGALPIRGNCFTKAFECQIMMGDDPKGMWSRHGDLFAIQGASFVPDRPHPQGWMRCLPSEKRVKGPGEWNHYRIVSRDGALKLEANGKEVSGGTKCNPRKGYLCLESEGAECHFRNLRIQELPSSNPGPSEISEADEGYTTLYGGDLRGWKTESAADWKAKDWVFEASGKGGPLATDHDFGEFALIFDWRSVNTGKAEVLLPGDHGFELEAKKPGQWNRVQIVARRDSLSITSNEDAPGKVEKGSAGSRGPIGFKATLGPVQFANVYIRELR